MLHQMLRRTNRIQGNRQDGDRIALSGTFALSIYLWHGVQRELAHSLHLA
jgi:hypothetical protein